MFDIDLDSDFYSIHVHLKTKVVLITGDSATGKSLFRKLITKAQGLLNIKVYQLAYDVPYSPDLAAVHKDDLIVVDNLETYFDESVVEELISTQATVIIFCRSYPRCLYPITKEMFATIVLHENSIEVLQ